MVDAATGLGIVALESSDSSLHCLLYYRRQGNADSFKANLAVTCKKVDGISALTTCQFREATVAELTLDVKEANGLLAKIESFMQEATTIRQTGKEENAVAIKDPP
eukprot:1255485-Amphidinium_carterae.1